MEAPAVPAQTYLVLSENDSREEMGCIGGGLNVRGYASCTLVH